LWHATATGSATVAIEIGSFTFGARLGDVIVSLAQWTASSSAGEPWVKTSSVEGMPAAEATNVIVIFQDIYADSTRVSWVGEQFRGNGCVNVILFFFILLLLDGGLVFGVYGTCGCLHLFQGRHVFAGGLGGGLLLATFLTKGATRGSCRGFDNFGRVVLGRHGRGLIVHGGAHGRRRYGVDISNAGSTTGWCRHTTGRGEAFTLACGHPVLIFGHGESFVHLVHSHQLLLPPSPMWSRHVLKIDRTALSGGAHLSVASVVPKTIFDTYDDPVEKKVSQENKLAYQVGGGLTINL
jgi:hypothetical protein